MDKKARQNYGNDALLPHHRFKYSRYSNGEKQCSHRSVNTNCLGDDCYIISQIKKLSSSEQAAACDEYSSAYKSAGIAETSAVERTNTARRAANTWLRDRIKRGTFIKPIRRL